MRLVARRQGSEVAAAVAALVLGLVLFGCGSRASGSSFREDEAAAGTGGGGFPCDGGGTVALRFSPSILQRDAAVDLYLTWELRAQIRLPLATITVGDDTVEVDVSLSRDTTQPNATYVGTLLNPFGVGAPTGSVNVLGHAQKWDYCAYSPVATTSFFLE